MQLGLWLWLSSWLSRDADANADADADAYCCLGGEDKEERKQMNRTEDQAGIFSGSFALR